MKNPLRNVTSLMRWWLRYRNVWRKMKCTKGNRPLRACGTRFVSHKVAAINRFIDRYGAYINHLITLTEDSSVKPADKQKFKGYIGKWKEAKIVFGCAMLHDLLKPACILCKALQYDDVSVTDALEAIVKTGKSIEKLKSLSFDELSTVKKVISRIQSAETDSDSAEQFNLCIMMKVLIFLQVTKMKLWSLFLLV